MTRRPKIVATIGPAPPRIAPSIGPASANPETLVRMIEAGMDVARLNFSHGSHEQHAETAQLVRDAAGRAGRPVALLQDLPGPKLRIGPLVEGTVELKVGDKVVFECGKDDGSAGDARRMSISWEGLARAIDPGEVL